MKKASPVEATLRVAPDAGLGRPFAALWAATAASNLADGLVVVLLPLIALRVTDAPAAVAAVTVATTAAWPVFGLAAGLAVDMFDRRRVLLAVNAARCGLLTALAFAWTTDSLSLAVLYGAALILGAGETLADTSLTSMVPAVVQPARRGAANARIETTINLLNQLAGPPLAGALIVAGVALAAGATAAVYAVALVGLALLPRASFAAAGAAGRLAPRSELTAGIRTLWRHPLLRRLTLLTAAMNIAWGVWSGVFVLYAVAPGDLGLTPAQYGLLLAAMALGGLAVAAWIGPLARMLGVRALLFLDLVGTVALVAPPALGLGMAPVAAGAIAAGAGSTVWRTIVATIRQNTVEDRLLGRVYAASRMISWGVLPFGAAVGGVVAQLYGVRAALAAASVLAVLLVLAFPPLTRGHDLEVAYNGST